MATTEVSVTDGVVAGETNGAEKTTTVVFTAVKPRVFVEATKVGDAVSFYKSAFGAEEVTRVTHPKRKADQELPLIMSAEIKLGESSILVSDVSDESAAPGKTVSSGLEICLETEDIEAAIETALKAGAVAEGEVSEGDGACCGGRVGKVKDPYGVVWAICTPMKKAANVEA